MSIDQIRSEHLMGLASTTTDALIAIDSKSKVIFWNSSAESMFGHASSEIIGKPIHTIIPSSYHALHNAGVKRVNGNGEHHVIGGSVDLSAIKKDGTEFPISLTLSTWKVDDQPYYGAIIRDITSLVEMTKDLEHRANKIQAILNSANDAIITADSKGMIISWNKSAAKTFGYQEEEMIGKALTVIIPEHFRKAHETGIKRVTSGGKHHVIGQTAELAGLHKSGEMIPIELSLSTWEVDGEKFYSGIIRDISERKKAEAKLSKSNEKLEKKAEELKTLNEEVHSKNHQLQDLSEKLAKYLSRKVYTDISEGKKDVRIESYRKKLTVFFSDIEGFTELTDRVESEVLTLALNKYLNEMSKIANRHGGTIDKFIGDAIMIFFGDPDTNGEKEDAIACVKMAIEMRDRLAEMRREWRAMGVTTPLRIRMGINSGFCTVGNFGSDDRLDYTIVGSSVNLASRLESAADTDEILISQDTYALISDEIKCKRKGELKAKGLAYPVVTYEVIDEYRKITLEDEVINADLEGFKLSIEFEKLDISDKGHIKEWLEKALTRLD